MATTQEEPQLILTLVDNTSAQMNAIRQSLTGLKSQASSIPTPHVMPHGGGYQAHASGWNLIAESIRNVQHAAHGLHAFPGLITHFTHLQEHSKHAGTGINQASSSLLNFGRSASLVAGGVLALGYAFKEGVEGLSEFSNELNRLDTVAKSAGVAAGQIKAIQDQLREVGIPEAQTQQMIQRFSATVE